MGLSLLVEGVEDGRCAIRRPTVGNEMRLRRNRVISWAQ